MKVETKNVILDIIFTVLTAGLWNFWVQYRQIRDYNAFTKEHKYSFLLWCLFTLITFGLYHIYHEYRLTKDIFERSNVADSTVIATACAIATAFGLWFIVDSIQQNQMNYLIDKNSFPIL